MSNKPDKEAIINSVYRLHRIDLKNPKFDVSVVNEMMDNAMESFSASQNSELKKENEVLGNNITILQSIIDQKNKETKRLKGLIEDMWWYEVKPEYYPYHSHEINEKLLHKFKTENNL